MINTILLFITLIGKSYTRLTLPFRRKAWWKKSIDKDVSPAGHNLQVSNGVSLLFVHEGRLPRRFRTLAEAFLVLSLKSKDNNLTLLEKEVSWRVDLSRTRPSALNFIVEMTVKVRAGLGWNGCRSFSFYKDVMWRYPQMISKCSR